ncbi:MAG TPA: hypothetical protein VG033_12555 [Candidatus Acidoferrales bacterium]|jgi:hypothetical protein|nr:hypothetical protein [Candidatus Acidoferrales bacterium]
MKRFITLGAVLALALLLVPAVHAQNSQSNQLMQGTQVRLILLNGLSTSVARDGDPFTAVVAEPVFLGGQLILPAGSKVHGVVGSIVHARHFAIFRGQAAMNLQFRSLEIEGREIPAQMSILQLFNGSVDGGRTRKDLKTEEGVVVEAKRDVKGYVTDVAIGTSGGTVVGAIFSHVMRGFAFGLIGGTAYVIQKKGKEVELPAQTGILVRLDNSVALPSGTARVGAYSGQP